MNRRLTVPYLFVLIALAIWGSATAQEATTSNNASADSKVKAGDAKPSKHLSTSTVDLPVKYKLDSQNGLAIKVKEGDQGVDVLFLFYGYRHFSGAMKLTRILMHFPRGKNVLNVADCKKVLYEKQVLDCLSGYLVLDRTAKKIELDIVVFDDDDWRRFGWNGVWDYEEIPDLDIEEIRINMGHEKNP
ncbi:MAG: hypothetical protein JNL96_07320 [Planctomycetaceae bacterium]|nr:hypothetical protein [Planctomycetaceae bacterium]